MSPTPPRLAVLASGRGSNLEALLDAERSGRLGARVALVLSDREDARALDVARAAGKPARAIDPGPSRSRLSPEAEDRFLDALRGERIDLVALAGFMRIVGARLIAEYPGRVLNIHPSLLPAFPGLEAPRQALEHGVRFAGCTAHLVTDRVDAGPILLQAVVPVHELDTPEALAARILAREHEIYPEAVRLVAEGKVEVSGRRVRLLPGGNDGH